MWLISRRLVQCRTENAEKFPDLKNTMPGIIHNDDRALFAVDILPENSRCGEWRCVTSREEGRPGPATVWSSASHATAAAGAGVRCGPLRRRRAAVARVRHVR